MIGNNLHKALVEEMRKRIPQNSQLVKKLINILFIEKEAVYRRLKGDVSFTFNEVAVIVKELGISLDTLIGVEVEKSQPFRMKLPEFVYPEKIDLYQFTDYINFLKKLSITPNTEMGVVTNMIPQELFAGFSMLVKYHVFKWQYFFNNHQAKPFDELIVPDKVMGIFKLQFAEMKKIKVSHYIFDKHIFSRIAKDIDYFKNIRLMKDEDITLIKRDLLDFLNYIEKTTITGRFPETGARIFLYIADLDITMSFYYVESDEIHYSQIKAFILTSATSQDKKTFLKMKDWIRTGMKASNLITETQEQQRILYFEQQRKIVNAI